MSKETPGETSPDSKPEGESTSKSAVLPTVVIVLLLLGGAAGLSAWIQGSEPTAQREAATRKSAALVETVMVERGSYRPVVRVLGAVQPAREIVLSPRVSGEIVEVHDAFRPGGLVKAGDPLLRLDPADAEQALVIRESALVEVQAELALEEGQQRAAQLEFELLGQEIDPVNRALILREPQITALRGRIRSAEASLQQARLDLERTRIAAPFDAQILERFVDLGSQVAAGNSLARLVATDEYWVVATVPLSALRWIPFPAGDSEGNTAGARAKIHHRAVWKSDQFRDGVVERLIGEVDAVTRLARVIVSVPRPLGGDGEPPLILGSVVRVEIEGKPIDECVRLDRAYLRQGDTVWVMDAGELRVREVEVIFADDEHAYVGAGLESGDRVIMTDLSTVRDGLSVREGGSAETEAGTPDGGSPANGSPR